MESKIEKLERVKPMSLMGMMGEVAPQWVAKELNKIIDHLNSQDQAEEVYSKTIEPLERGRVYKGVPIAKSTPEQKEEWEERTKKEFFNKFNWDYLFSKGTKEIVWDYVKQLLLEREREVEENLLKRLYSAKSKKEFRDMLDKLLNKKK